MKATLLTVGDENQIAIDVVFSIKKWPCNFLTYKLFI